MADTDLLFKIKADASGVTKGFADARTVAEKEVNAIVTHFQKANQYTAVQKNATDVLIAESQKAIANAEKAALSAEQGITRTTNALGRAQTEAQSFGSRISSLVGPVTAIAGGITIAGGAVLGLGTALFKVAQSAASFGAHLNDLSQRTGLSVETLSTLKVAADTSGGSIESVNNAIGRYLKTVSDANHGSEKAVAAFKQVGFTVAELKEAFSSPDEAVRLLIDHIGKMSNEEDKLNALTKVGIRNGQEFSAVIKEMGGDFEAFRRKAEGLGLVITKEQAQAADKFDDSLKILELQIRAISYSIGRELMPVVQSAISDTSESLEKNKNSWKSWGQDAAYWITETRAAIKFMEGDLQEGIKILADFKLEQLHRAALEALPADLSGGASDVNTRVREGILDLGDAVKKEKKKRREKTPDERGQEFLDQLAEQSKLVFALSEESRVKIQLERKEYDGLNETLKQNIIIKAQELDTRKHALDFQKKEEQAVEQTRQFLERQNEQLKEFREGAATAMDAVDKFLESLRREGLEPDNPTLVGILRLKAVMIDVATWAKEDAAAIDNLHERFAALGPQLVLTAEQLERIKSGNFLTAKDLSELGTPPPLPGGAIDIWKEWGDTVSKALGLGKTQSETFARAFSAVAGQVAQGVGAMVRAFVLFGNSGGSFRKFAAEVIASVAEMAVVQAVFELAQGLAMLALSYFTGNPKYAASASEHFLAAAVFGAIGGVAAIAGRVVAGNAFQEQGAGSTATGSSTGTTQTTPPPVVRTEDRNPQHLIVEVRSKDSHILNVFEKDVQNNGRTRGLIIQTAGAT